MNLRKNSQRVLYTVWIPHCSWLAMLVARSYSIREKECEIGPNFLECREGVVLRKVEEEPLLCSRGEVAASSC